MLCKGVFPSIVFVALITLKTVGWLRLSCHYIFLEHVLVMFTIMDHCWLYKDRCHLYSHDVEGDLRSTVVCIKMRDTYIDTMRRGAEMD